MSTHRDVFFRFALNRLNSWVYPVCLTLESISKLKNWDSFGGEPPSELILVTTLLVLLEVTTNKTPFPQIVPGCKNDIQIEWHTQGINLGIYISQKPDVIPKEETDILDLCEIGIYYSNEHEKCCFSAVVEDNDLDAIKQFVDKLS